MDPVPDPDQNLAHFYHLSPPPSHVTQTPSSIIPHSSPLLLTPPPSSITLYPSPLAPPPALLLRKLHITSLVRLWRRKNEDLEEIYFLSLAKNILVLDPDPYQLERGIRIRIKRLWIRHTA